MIDRLDDLRGRFPHLGFGVYAYEPGKPVTLEIHTPDGKTYEIRGPTLGACITKAFPETEPAPPAPEPEPEPPTEDPFG